MRRILSTAAAALVLLSSLSIGTALAAGTPEQLVVDYMAALRKDGMKAVPGFIHPDELGRFKGMLMPLLQREAATGDTPVSDALFGKGTKLEQVEAMSGADFMGALMGVVGDKLEETVKFGDVQVLGSVRENDVVHVVTRISVEAGTNVRMKTMAVVSAKPFAGGWKLMLTGELEGLAAGLASQ